MKVYPSYYRGQIDIEDVQLEGAVLDITVTRVTRLCDEISFIIDTTETHNRNAWYGDTQNCVTGIISIENAEKVIAEIQEFIQRVKIQQFIEE